jgi:hypothetical protein
MNLIKFRKRKATTKEKGHTDKGNTETVETITQIDPDNVLLERKKKKGNKLLGDQEMKHLIALICEKQESIDTKKTDLMMKHKKIQDDANKKIKQKRIEKKLELKAKKRELKGASKPNDVPSDMQDATVEDDTINVISKKRVNFKLDA